MIDGHYRPRKKRDKGCQRKAGKKKGKRDHKATPSD